MLDTDYYNNRLASINACAELDAIAASLIETIDAYDSLMIGMTAQLVNETGSLTAAQEALGDYIQKGSGSILSGIANIYRTIYNMGVWTLKLIKNMVVFAIKGFKGTVGGAIKEIEKIGDQRVKQMKDRHFSTGVSTKSCTQMVDVMKEHVLVPKVNVPAGKIAYAKNVFLEAFNKKMSTNAKVDRSFAMTNPPALMHMGTLEKAGCTSAKAMTNAGESLLASETILKKRLNEAESEGKEVKVIVEKIRSKGYKDRYTKGAGTTSVLLIAFKSAILANDLKYLYKMEDAFTGMVHSVFKKSAKYVEAA